MGKLILLWVGISEICALELTLWAPDQEVTVANYSFICWGDAVGSWIYEVTSWLHTKTECRVLQEILLGPIYDWHD